MEFVATGVREVLEKWLWLLRHRVPYVYCSGGWLRNVLPAVLARPFTGSKVVADFDEVMSRWPSRKKWLYRILERHLIPRLDGLVVVSAAMEAWAQQLGASPERVFRVPFAADTPTIASIAAQVRQAGKGHPRVELGYLGSLTQHYDFWYLLDAVELLSSQWPGVLLHLVGDGPARVALEERARSRGLDGQIQFHGFLALDDAIQCLAGCDVLLFPIRDTRINHLRCPQKSYIFLATGTPIVTCAVGEVGTACGEFAQYFTMDDPTSLVEAVRMALKEPEGRRVLRREFAATHHSWEIRARDCWAQLSKGIFSPTS